MKPVAVVVCVAIGAAACSSSPSSSPLVAGSSSRSSIPLPSTTAAAAAGSGSTTTQAPQPAGPNPSSISTMVCSTTAQKEISSIIGVSATVSTPTWVDHLYSCNYRYASGPITLSVKELSSAGETDVYFNGLAASLGNKSALANLGQGAFVTTNGSVVVRKDWKVLLVDISRLSGSIGNPPYTPPQAANTVADIILGCWAGD